MKMNDSGNIFTQFFAWVAALASAIGFTTQDLVFMFFGAAGLLISLASYINGRVDANCRRREDEKRTKHANRLISLIDTSSEETIIEYREIFRREQTCDLPVPADISGGLLKYAYCSRASSLHTDTNRPDTADDRAAAASSKTYCQAVLWIKPLLAVIEKGNNNFAGIRQIELERNYQGWLVLEHTGIPERRLYLT